MAAKSEATMKRVGLEKIECQRRDTYMICDASVLVRQWYTDLGCIEKIQYIRCAASLNHSWALVLMSDAVRITANAFMT